jgi:demethylmenaquinone methyltransferase/2-methoxy-6-polyprenyl-1,4-benzoquinol methylase
MVVLPYKNLAQGRKTQVTLMFDNIAGRYDLLNHLLSFNMDRRWRKKAIGFLRDISPEYILDVATGTGDFAIAAMRLHPEKVVGIDISAGMLEKGRRKVEKKNLSEKIQFRMGDSEELPFPDCSFDAATAGFGVRNFENLPAGLGEIFRVLKKGGQLVILEFSKPAKFPFRQLYGFYSSAILPGVGGVISGDRSAYSYLPDSVKAFPAGNDFLEILQKVGFVHCNLKPLTFGIVTIYSGFKA